MLVILLIMYYNINYYYIGEVDMDFCDCCEKTNVELYDEVLFDKNGNEFTILVCEECHWRIDENSRLESNN